MLWSGLFSSPAELTASEVADCLTKKTDDAFQLVDVRQENEYRQSHLPGALLIPLGELENRFAELDPSLETIVYCRSGARSRSACQFLQERGFEKIYNMKGGILAWQGQQVMGDERAGLGYFLDRDYASVYELSCNLEAGLQRFYRILRERAEEEGSGDIAAFLSKMAAFEDAHIARLKVLHDKEFPGTPLQIDSRFAEGGLSLESLLAAFGGNLDSVAATLHLAMSFEAQAVDLYFRLQRRTEDKAKKKFFTEMIREERGHLALLAAELDRLAAS